MSELTQFRGILPPSAGSVPPEGATASARCMATPDGLILRTLSPFRDELDFALARGDHSGALRLAYAALAASRTTWQPAAVISCHRIKYAFTPCWWNWNRCPWNRCQMAHWPNAAPWWQSIIETGPWIIPWPPHGRGHLPNSSMPCGPAHGLWWGENESQG